MRLKEQRLWDALKKQSPKELWLQRVENVVGVGMPDVYVGANGAWIELKSPTCPKKETTRLLGDEGLNQDQINWHYKAMKKMRQTYILIRDSQSRLFLIPGALSLVVNDMNAAELLKWSLGENWEEIIKVIST